MAIRKLIQTEADDSREKGSREAAELYRGLLLQIGEDPERDGLVRTPERAAKAIEFLTRGYRTDPEAVLRDALFDVAYDEMVIVKDIEMFSLCEHHMLPFFGKV